MTNTSIPHVAIQTGVCMTTEFANVAAHPALNHTCSPTSPSQALTAEGDPKVTIFASSAALSTSGGTALTPEVLYVFMRVTAKPLAVSASCGQGGGGPQLVC